MSIHPLRFPRQLDPGRLLIGALLVAAIGCGGSASERRDGFIQGGQKAIAAGNVNEAVIAFKNAVQADPVSAEARLGLADALTKQGDARGALAEYVRAADLKPDDADLQVKTGNLLLAIGKLDDAKSRAERVLAGNPSHVEAHILLGNTLGGYQDLDKALAQMEEAIRLDPTRAGTHMQLAIVQQAMGKKEDAEAAFKKAISLDPKWIGGHMALGSFYLSIGRLADARTELDAALALDPNHLGANRAKAVLAFVAGRPVDAEAPLKRLADLSNAIEPQLSLGDYYFATGKLNEAIAILERLSKDSRNHLAVMPRLVRAYASSGNRKAARALVDRLLKENPENHAMRALDSQLLLDEGRRENALASAQAAVKGDPASAVSQFTLGKAYAAVGDRSGAETAFREVLKINPRAAPAQVELSLLQIAEKGDGAVRRAEEAVAAQPGNPDAKLALIRSLLASGDLVRAESEINLLQSRRPSAAGYVQAGGLALARNDLARAKVEFTKALELSPDSIEALAGQLAVDLRERNGTAARGRLAQRLSADKPPVELLLLAGRTYFALNDLKETEAILRRAIELEPSSLPAYSMLGQTYLRLNRLDEARAEFDRLAARQSRPVGALTASGTILQAQGRVQEARERFERVIGIDPGAAVAANNLAWIYADSGQNLDKAVQLAQSALERLPDVPDVLDTLAWAYYKSNTPALAIRPLTRCIAVAPGAAAAGCHYHLGLVHAKLGDVALAEQNLRTAIKLQGKAPWVADAQRALAALPAAK
jgi:tetratricopeptide (TPR) repeat protein